MRNMRNSIMTIVRSHYTDFRKLCSSYPRLAPAGKKLAQHFYQSKQASSDALSRLHRHTATLISGLKRLDQRQRETEAFIDLQKRYEEFLSEFSYRQLFPRFNMRTMEYHNLNVEAHLNEVGPKLCVYVVFLLPLMIVW